MEQTLFQAKEVTVFKIPPRAGAGGHKSGEWKVVDKIFTGRLRVMSIGDMCELRLEDPGSGELFAMCPVPLGQRDVAVEPVSDSSRYFVLRLVDATTKRHAFIGMGFADRSDAFDFNVALSDHEKYIRRAEEAETAAKEPTQAASSEAAALYQKQDLSLKEGETIKINVRRASADKAASSGGGGGSFLAGLPPPPASQGGAQPWSLAPPAPVSGLSAQQGASTSMQEAGVAHGGNSTMQQQQSSNRSLTGLFDSGNGAPQTPAATATQQDGWATF